MGHYRKKLITFVMSEACNMACRYCYSDKNMANKFRSLSLDFAYTALEDFIVEGINAIRFFGVGEATMEPEKMEHIWDYASNHMGNKIYTEIQTNGTFPQATCFLLGKIADMVWISCDGTPDVQNHQRIMKDKRLSAGIIERNVHDILNCGKKVGFRATISATNLHRQKEMIDYFINLGASCAFADLVCLPIMHGFGEYKVDCDEYVKEFIEAKRYAEAKGFFYSNFYMVNFDENVEIPCRSNLPMPHVMPSGYISACDMVTDITGSLLDNLLYGKYDETNKKIVYDEDKLALIRGRTVERLPGCEDCQIKYYCAGGCIGEAINETGDFYGIKKYLCRVTKALAKEFGVGYAERYLYLHP